MTDLTSVPRGIDGLFGSNPYTKAIKFYFSISNRHSGTERFVFLFFFSCWGHSLSIYMAVQHQGRHRKGRGSCRHHPGKEREGENERDRKQRDSVGVEGNRSLSIHPSIHSFIHSSIHPSPNHFSKRGTCHEY